MRATELCGALLLLAAFSSAGAQDSRLVAHVLTADTHQPIVSAEIVMPALRRLGRADSSGLVRLGAVPRGVQRVRVRFFGFASADVDLQFDADSVEATFLLERAVGMDTVHVIGARTDTRLAEFESRRRMGIGRFIGGDELARQGTRDFGAVAQARFPGVRMMSAGDGHVRLASLRGQCGNADKLGRADDMPGQASGSTRGTGRFTPAGGAGAQNTMQSSCAQSQPCWIRVFLDGIELGIDADLVRTWDLAGAEYYTGAQMPPQYRVSGSSCGVLVLWSRRWE